MAAFYTLRSTLARLPRVDAAALDNTAHQSARARAHTSLARATRSGLAARVKASRVAVMARKVWTRMKENENRKGENIK